MNNRKDFRVTSDQSTEADAPNPTGTDSTAPGTNRRSTIRRSLVVIALAVTLATAVGVSGLAWGIGSLRVVARSESLPDGMRALTIDTGDMPTVIRITSDRNVREPHVRMRLVSTAQTDRAAVNVTQNGDAVGLTVAGAPLRLFDVGSPGEITVTLPPYVAHRLSVTTKQQTGALLTQTDLDLLTVHSTEGAVLLGGNARRVDIHTAGGEIRTRDAISVTDAFIAETDSGRIAVDFRDAAPRTVQASGRDTDIEIALPPAGPYMVHAQASDDLKVRVPQTDNPARAAAQITARADDGSVVITTRR